MFPIGPKVPVKKKKHHASHAGPKTMPGKMPFPPRSAPPMQSDGDFGGGDDSAGDDSDMLSAAMAKRNGGGTAPC